MQPIDEWSAVSGCGCGCACGGSEFTVVLAARATGFNGRVPGPTVEARTGDVLVLKLINELDHAATLRLQGTRSGEPEFGGSAPPGGTAELRVRLNEAGVFSYTAVGDHPMAGENLYGALIVVPCCGART